MQNKLFMTIIALSVAILSALPSNLIAEEKALSSDKQAVQLIKETMKALGGKDNFYDKKGVTYSYLYRAPNGEMDLSQEDYIFDGEKSKATYVVHEKFVMPKSKGDVVQSYDGKKTTVTIGDKPVTDPKALQTAEFLRKTNYYWFTMMFKLLDQGSYLHYKGKRSLNGIKYDLVELTYADGVGDVSDIYLLYVNPTTKLIDTFLFTVLDFGLTDPLIMEVEYQTVDGITLPLKRRYTKANWDGKVLDDQWTDEISFGVKFLE